MDGHEFNGAKFAVDAADKLVDDGAQVLVLFDVLAGGDGNLYEDDLADPFWVLCEEDFEGVQLLGDAFDVVEAINADD